MQAENEWPQEAQKAHKKKANPAFPFARFVPSVAPLSGIPPVFPAGIGTTVALLFLCFHVSYECGPAAQL